MTSGRRPPRAVMGAVTAAGLLLATTGARSVASVALATSCPAAGSGVHSSAPGTGKTVALTFDDGPGTSTAQIMSTLMTHGVRATFFNLGLQTARNPSAVRSEVQQGHTVGNHTWDHPRMPSLSAARQADEIDRTTSEQVAVVGRSPCLFRPPYGSYNSTTLAVAAARGLSVWTWSVDPEDWKADGSASRYWVSRIVARAEAGGSQRHPVVLFHNADGAGDAATVAALPTVIAYYRSHGYAFVDLLGHRGFAPYAPTGSAAPALAPTTAGLHLFWRDASGHVSERTQTAGAWSAATGLGGATPYPPAAARRDAGSVLVAVTDSSHHVVLRTVGDHGLSTWGSLGGSVTGRPAITVDAAGTVTVAARTSEGSVVVRQRVRGEWRPWTSLGGTFVTAPSLASTPAGGVAVSEVAADGALWVRTSGSTGWAAWRRVGGLTLTADPALAIAPDGKHLLAFGRDETGAIRVRAGSLDAMTWGTWQNLRGVLRSGPAATVAGTTVVVAAFGTDGVGRLDTAASAATPSVWSGWIAIPR